MTSRLARIGRRVRAHWQLKVRLSFFLTLFFCIPYFTLQRLPMFPARRLELGSLDEAIAFDPRWVWVYQSVYLLMTLVPWLSTRADDLRRYARGFVLQASIGFLFFLLLPIEGPRPEAAHNAGSGLTDGLYRLLVSYDRSTNCFPSLHVGLAVYTVLFAAAIGRERSSGPTAALLAALWLWVAAISYATLATKQHYAVDLPAGFLLAWMCHRWIWRASERSLHGETLRLRRLRTAVDGLRQRRRAAAAGAGQPAGGGGSRSFAAPQSNLRAGDS